MFPQISLKGALKTRYPNLVGKDWITTITAEDRLALLEQVRARGLYGRLGGLARAQTADRGPDGRFLKKGVA